jgi:hypothetical protein
MCQILNCKTQVSLIEARTSGDRYEYSGICRIVGDERDVAIIRRVGVAANAARSGDIAINESVRRRPGNELQGFIDNPLAPGAWLVKECNIPKPCGRDVNECVI